MSKNNANLEYCNQKSSRILPHINHQEKQIWFDENYHVNEEIEDSNSPPNLEKDKDIENGGFQQKSSVNKELWNNKLHINYRKEEEQYSAKEVDEASTSITLQKNLKHSTLRPQLNDSQFFYHNGESILSSSREILNDKDQNSFKNFRQSRFKQQLYNSELQNNANEKVMSKVVNASEFIVKFRKSTFFKFWMYHLLFFYFGFLSVPFILIFDSISLANNMSFWVATRNRMHLYVQLLQWFVNVLLISLIAFSYMFPDSPHAQVRNIYLEQFFFFNTQVLIRTFIISIRYGFASPFRLRMLSKAKQDFKYISNDFLIFQWFQFSPDGLDLEIDAACFRNQVEESRFKFSFIEELSDEVKEQLTNANYYKDGDNKFSIKNLKKDYKSKSNTLVSKQDRLEKLDLVNDDIELFSFHSFKHKNYNFDMMTPKYNGKLLLKQIGLFAGAHQRSTTTFLLVMSIIRVLIPYFMRIYDYGTPFGFNASGAVFSFFETITNLLYIILNYSFIIIGLIDFQRRQFMIKACGAMLTPYKDSYETKYQLFPTVNLACKTSLHSWFVLRCCIMDFGKKYMLRIFMYSSSFLAYYFFYAVVLVLSFFRLIDFQFSPIFTYIALFDIVFVVGIIMIMMNSAAEINQQFIEHKLQLVKMKQTLFFIKANLEEVLEGSLYTGPYLKIYQKIFKALYEELSSEEIIEHIDFINTEIDVITERLELDFQLNPLRLMGLKVTNDLMFSLYTSIITVVFAVGQQFISSRSSGAD